MSSILQFFRKYPIATTCYLLYTLFLMRVLQIHLQFHETLKHLKPGQSGLAAGGEAAGWVDLFCITLLGIFLFAVFANALARKGDTKFYLWFSFIIIIQTILVFNLG